MNKILKAIFLYEFLFRKVKWMSVKGEVFFDNIVY